MARKISKSFAVEIRKNTVKGGAWMVRMVLIDEDNNIRIKDESSAWANASAAQRFVKEIVKEWTPRKSVKLIGTMDDEKGKPTLFAGTVAFKADA